MIRVGIDLDHVVRNINKQIVKYYKKDYEPSLDDESIDLTDDVTKILGFKHKNDLYNFLYIDYPYEVYGCAKTMDKNLPSEINKWLYNLTNYENDEIEIFYYSMNEDALTIQSSYFFLSRIGTRVRKVLFPKNVNDIIDAADVLITANPLILDKSDKTFNVLIKRTFNKDSQGKYDAEYDSLEDLINDASILDKWSEYIKKNN